MSGSIYFVKPVDAAGPIKIGFARNVSRRFATMASDSPVKLELLVTVDGHFDLERNIHACLFDLHSHGEWFHPGERLIQIIADLRRGMALTDAVDLSDRRGNIRSKPWSIARRLATKHAGAAA